MRDRSTRFHTYSSFVNYLSSLIPSPNLSLLLFPIFFIPYPLSIPESPHRYFLSVFNTSVLSRLCSLPNNKLFLFILPVVCVKEKERNVFVLLLPKYYKLMLILIWHFWSNYIITFLGKTPRKIPPILHRKQHLSLYFIPFLLSCLCKIFMR